MKNIFKFLIIIIIALGCKSPVNNENKQTENQGKTLSVYINTIDNQAIASFSIFDETISIKIGQKEIIGRINNEGTKYFTPDNSLLYIVKSEDEKVKLKDADHNLIWKAKISEEKVKISNNEEMENAYSIKVYDDNRLKLKLGETELEEVILSSKNAPLNIKNTYLIIGMDLNEIAGILLIDEIKDIEKYILMAELFRLQ